MTIRNSYISHADGRNDCYTIRFWRYRGRRLSFSCFALPDSFSAVPRESALVFMFCATILVFGSTEGVESLFQVLRVLTHFRRYLWCRVSFSCFARPDSFSAAPRASGSRFHILHFRTHFRRYEGILVIGGGFL
jgi:hypothetical protein